MSKTQEKRERRKTEQLEFLAERHAMNLAMFEQNFEAGLAIYEANKDKMSPEDVATIEAQIESNRKLLDELKNV